MLEKRQGPAPEAAFKVGESTLEIAGHYFADVLRAARPPRRRAPVEAAASATSSRPATTATSRAASSGARRRRGARPVPHQDVPDRPRRVRERARRPLPLERATTCVTAAPSRTSTSAPGTPTTASRSAARATSRRPRPLDRRRHRPCRLHEAQARARAGRRAHDQPASWLRLAERARAGRLVGRRGVAGADAAAEGALALHEPPDGRGLLGVADPARHRRRSRSGSSPTRGSIRSSGSRPSRLRSTGSPSTSRSSPRPCAARPRRRARTSSRVEDYAYQVERVYSPQRWCLTGDAGAFTDPFYSPGSDFIALGNTCITDLVVRDPPGRAGRGTRLRRFNDSVSLQAVQGASSTSTLGHVRALGQPAGDVREGGRGTCSCTGASPRVRYVQRLLARPRLPGAETSRPARPRLQLNGRDPALLPRVARDRRPGGSRTLYIASDPRSRGRRFRRI